MFPFCISISGQEGDEGDGDGEDSLFSMFSTFVEGDKEKMANKPAKNTMNKKRIHIILLIFIIYYIERVYNLPGD